jgi:hypothetical protein
MTKTQRTALHLIDIQKGRVNPRTFRALEELGLIEPTFVDEFGPGGYIVSAQGRAILNQQEG